MTVSGQPPSGDARVDQNMFTATLAEVLAQGDAVLLRVQGVSMLPWLREGEQVRILPAAGRRLRRGDIALFWREPRRPILHRVVKVRRGEGLYECRGDSESGTPERVPASAVIGLVEMTAFRRAVFLALHPVRRLLNRLCLSWGVQLRHG